MSGYARSGKDTVGEILAQEHGFVRLAFADKLKKLALVLDPQVAAAVTELGGWEQAKKIQYVREYLQLLGTSARDILFESVWIDALLSDLDATTSYVITDVRFLNEAEAIRARDGIMVRISRPGVGPVNQHISEIALDDYPFDVYLKNDGSIPNLADQLRNVLGL
ncbi:hypothetical protein [Ferrimicrobium acidiphilum]|jgi:hypothetical protein|uniref:deoxynucleotide monophosphate kinase family protein n=1 Tax=Ferrimicrobium acidiphilum TaxID=121039 RepID=UPI0023F2BBAD|nr:hypothetical protein [Ferrimicrobium acidiphilum]